ncbi:uncharacterized protein LOC127528454 [Erpetoichthys calabaricus]|uniref:uncharacterized protein LOC127528454 n=1 Tax=Erpetoichthys calabaricus TaxID=27687 RepID=UPI002234A30C|nr:uncharacterized protein LOC127528454 [Erpetoichthys calabaricus]XP_051785290.1 uncharacterized protein LOC127528454 [Erpetoichthys calabaricus]
MTEGQDLNAVLNTLVAELQAVKLDTAATKAELSDTRRRLAAAEAVRPEPARPPLPSMVALTADDDIESYLSVFERTASRNQWPRAEWASLLAPYLKGPAQRAYHDLPEEEAAQYDLLKAEIYLRYGVTSGQQARAWRHWRFDPALPARAQAFEYWGKLGRWLRPDRNQARQVVEQVACEGLIHAMPDYLAQQVRRHPFKDMNGLLEVLERQLAVTQLRGSDGSSRGSRQGRPVASEPYRRPAEAPVRPKERKLVLPRCFKCGEPGHLLPACPLNQEPMDCTWTREERKAEAVEP